MLTLLPPHGHLHNYSGTVLQHAPPPSTKQLLISKIPLTKMQETFLKCKILLTKNARNIAEMQNTVDQNARNISEMQNTVDQNARNIAEMQALLSNLTATKKAVINNTKEIESAINKTIADIQNTVDQNAKNIAEMQALLSNLTDTKKTVVNNTKEIESLEERVNLLHPECGSQEWTRVAYLDMSDASQSCPNALRLYSVSGVRACGRQVSSVASCDSITFTTNNTYTEVCGRVIGYQYASPDAFDFLRRPLAHRGIDNAYVDGISITHGSPRQHIWTLVGSVFSNGQEGFDNHCPCDGSGTISAPDFVGEDYFCESGNPSSQIWTSILYTDDPIWDGENCGISEVQCCNTPGIPWFHKVLNSPTTDNIELRVCGEEDTTNEDTPLAKYEIYVK